MPTVVELGSVPGGTQYSMIELTHLSRALPVDERVLLLANGRSQLFAHVKKKLSLLIVCTDSQVFFFLRHTLFGHLTIQHIIALQAIRSISQKISFMTSSVTIDTTDGNSCTIHFGTAKVIPEFVSVLTTARENFIMQESAILVDGFDVGLGDQLEKLVNLRNNGALTDEEFETAKKRLLAG